MPRPFDSRRPCAHRFIAVSLFLGLIFLSSAPSAAGSGTLKIGRNQDSTTFDPILISQSTDFWVVANANETLVRNNLDGTGVEPDLAESWAVSPDGLIYKFKLREGLKFSDGSPIKASDVKFSLERLRDSTESVFRTLYAPMMSIDIPDDRTVIITLDQPTASFLAALALYSAAVLPEDAVKNHYDEWLEHPIGAGAFEITEWRRGESVTLDKNPNYWEGPAKPKLDRVQWIYIPNDETRIVKLQAGQIDAMTLVPFDRIDGLQRDPKLAVHLDMSRREDLLLINHSHLPLDRREVRQALCMAIDLDAIMKTVTFGHGISANPYLAGGSLFHNPDNPRCSHDPAQAKSMLQAAGVKSLPLKLVISSADVTHEQLARLLQSQLAQIGVTVEIEEQEAGQAWETEVAGDYDLSIDYWTDDIGDPDEKSSFSLYGDPDNLSYHTRYRNPEVSTLIDQGRAELDPGKRKAIYYKIQAIVKDDVPWIDLYYSPYRNASRTYVKNFTQNPLGRFTLEDTEIVK
jgi:peptide/nickel transport system substrate-binding protein